MTASRSRFVVCALLLATQALARPEQLDGERNQAAEMTESKVVERQQESVAQFFPSPSVSPSPSPPTPTIQCRCDKPAIKFEPSRFPNVVPPGYYACNQVTQYSTFTAYCPIFPGDVPCRCPFGWFATPFNDDDDFVVCSNLDYPNGDFYRFPCDDDDDDDDFFDSPFFPSPSASVPSVPSVPSFFQEALRDLSDPVEKLKTDDLHLNDILDLDTSGSTKSRDSRVQALTNQSLDKLMEALKD